VFTKSWLEGTNRKKDKLPSVSCCVSEAPYRGSPACCGPGWPYCVPPVDGSSLFESETASSAGISAASAWSGSLPAEQQLLTKELFSRKLVILFIKAHHFICM